ncbi:CGNR zinc finger domain-containing protein [Silvibacterium acidisoli]|uniref:CGNR zinc finger domain-containing protein n=1 Tax=Acidobacteriaceae bacterium ZG23-2 TaxID=2883246 RepID=UPI00406D4AC6
MENSQSPSFLFLADHPVLDFLNTVAMVEGQRTDFLQTDGQVLEWLEQAGFPCSPDGESPHSTLKDAARNLRETARGLIAQRKAGETLTTESMNRLLAGTSSHLQLVATPEGGIVLRREFQGEVAARILAPLAESIAEFIATADFQLVRHCEGEGCILWFYDRTKSHRRRWCSMNVCGNRHKVSAYRTRRAANPE